MYVEHDGWNRQQPVNSGESRTLYALISPTMIRAGHGARLGRTKTKASECGEVVSFNPGEWCIEKFPARDDDDVDAVSDFVTPKELPSQPFGATSLNGCAHLPGRRHPQARVNLPVRYRKDHQQPSANPDASLVSVLELRPPPNTRGPPEGFVVRHRSNQASSATVSFFRPFARRRASTIRPFFVAMRTRKP